MIVENWDAGRGLSKTWTGRTKWVGTNGTVLYGPNYWQQLCAWVRRCFAAKYEDSNG